MKIFENDFLYFERYVNDGSPSGFSKNTTSYKTSPKNGDESFSLLEIKDSKKTFVLGKENKLFKRPFNYAHPDSINNPFLKKAGIKLSKYSVSPTSSGRTMLLLNDNINGFLFFSYDNNIGRAPRLILLKDALISLQNSHIIKQNIDCNKMPKTFAFLPEESAKVTILEHKGKQLSWGTIYRDYNPYPSLSDNLFYVPAFSLFSKDFKNKKNKPLITKLIDLSGKSAEEYLLNILDITVDAFFYLILTCGLYSEMHAQNCLYEIDENYNITRIILRDMQDICFDSMVKPIYYLPFMTSEFKNYILSFEKKTFENYELPKNKHLHQRDVSYYYDFKLGEYLLNPLIKTVSQYYDIDKNIFYKYVKNRVNDEYLVLFPDDYFPKEWYKIRKELYDFNDHNLDYYYVKKKNPKFR